MRSRFAALYSLVSRCVINIDCDNVAVFTSDVCLVRRRLHQCCNICVSRVNWSDFKGNSERGFPRNWLEKCKPEKHQIPVGDLMRVSNVMETLKSLHKWSSNHISYLYQPTAHTSHHTTKVLNWMWLITQSVSSNSSHSLFRGIPKHNHISQTT